MKNYISKKIVVIITIIFAVVMAAGFSSRSVPVAPAANAREGCPVTATEFNSWFTSGMVTLNGLVKPFVSDDFLKPSQFPPDCDFFKWSEQTFLWLTSPVQSGRGNQVNKGITDRVFDSPAFYDVSLPDADGNRTFIPHETGKIRVSGVRDGKVGPNHLPVTFEKKTGRLLEIETTPVSARGLPMILNKAGVQTEVTSVTVDNAMKPVLMDNTGKVIQNPRPVIRKRPNGSDEKSFVYKIMIDKKFVFLDALGNNIEVEEGQADGGVLMSQNNSLVYYSISVNQLYAFNLTYLKNGEFGNNFNDKVFPSYASPTIIEYAATHGKTIRYPEAAMIEIKCSWVEAASLLDAGKYIKMKATIPSYNKFASQWIPNGQKTVELAMVGMHIVGRVRWFPDMLWASFEHINNTPNAAYSYNNLRSLSTFGSKITVPLNTSGSWTFCADVPTRSFNVSRMHAEGNKIVANPGFTIGPSNIIRWKPWGSGGDNLITNTDLKTLNNSVMDMLIDGDVRKNYIQIGTTWKEDINPNSPEKGSTRLANSTMETYMQGTNNSAATGTTCYSCHTRNGDDKKAYSHIYYSIKPLFQ